MPKLALSPAPEFVPQPFLTGTWLGKDYAYVRTTLGFQFIKFSSKGIN